MKSFDVVVVEWEDCYADTTFTVNTLQDAAASYSPCIRRSVGYLVREDKQVVIIASDDDRDYSHPEACGGLIYIPKGCVRGVTHLAQTSLEFPAG